MSDLKRQSITDDEKLPSIKKRKYRKHPKPDPNAPKKPSPSAYHLFALEQGEKLRKLGYVFEDIARETGAMWRGLDPASVNDLEAKTTHAKTQYRRDIAAYKKSVEYKAYQEYLKRWMAKEEAKKKHLSGETNGPIMLKKPTPPPVMTSTSSSTIQRRQLQNRVSSTTSSPVSSSSIISGHILAEDSHTENDIDQIPPTLDWSNSSSTLKPSTIAPSPSSAGSSTSSQDSLDPTDFSVHDSKHNSHIGFSHGRQQRQQPHPQHHEQPQWLYQSQSDLSMQEQTEWKWSADYGMTLTTDPLFGGLHNWSHSSLQSQQPYHPQLASKGGSTNDIVQHPFPGFGLGMGGFGFSSEMGTSGTIAPSMLSGADAFLPTENPYAFA